MNNHVLHQYPYAFLLTSHFNTYVLTVACNHSEDLLIEKQRKTSPLIENECQTLTNKSELDIGNKNNFSNLF